MSNKHTKRRVELLPYQMDVLQAQEKEILLLGGIGTGKSKVAALWVIQKIVENRGCNVLMVANTHTQLNQATVATLTNTLDELNIKYTKTLHGSNKVVKLFDSTVYLYSLESYENIRGIEVEYIIADEMAFSCLEALQVIRGRLRGRRTDNRQMLITTSPNSFNFLYDEFSDSSDLTNKRVIKAQTKENIFLPGDYYNTLVQAYGGEHTPLARQELFGEFVSLTSAAVYSLFDRGINVGSYQLDNRFPVYVGLDFNIDNMNLVYMQHKQGILYVCKHICLSHRDANTVAAAQRIRNDLAGYDVRVVPDSTGKARKTNSSRSDHEILREHRLTVEVTTNPLIKDRQVSVNYAFTKKQLMIDASCTDLIKEIETLSGHDKEGDVAHASVAMGYVVWKIMPLKKQYSPKPTILL